MKLFKILLLSLLITSTAFAADYGQDEKIDGLSDAGAAMTRSTRIPIQDMNDTDKLGYGDLPDFFGLLEAADIFSLEQGTGLTGTNPDVDAVGEIGHDTDGGDLIGIDDESHRAFDGSNQYVVARKIKEINFTVITPASSPAWTGRANKGFPIWANNTGFTYHILAITAWSDTDNYDFSLFETNSSTDFSDENDTLIDLLECDADGTEVFTDFEDTLSHSVIENGSVILFEHIAGTANSVMVQILGWLDADVD